jgi:hypothetical protein
LPIAIKWNSRKKKILDDFFRCFCALQLFSRVLPQRGAIKNRKESRTVKIVKGELCITNDRLLQSLMVIDENRVEPARATTIMSQLIYVVMVDFPFFALLRRGIWVLLLIGHSYRWRIRCKD